VSQYFRIEIDQPQTSTKTAKSVIWTPDSEIVETADIELHKEGKRISTLTLVIWDPKSGGNFWPLTNSLPDPAFVNVPIRVYLSQLDQSSASAKKVFDGKITSMQPSFPALSNVTIVAHDNSFDARRTASYKTIKNKTSVQLAQTLASQYGLTVDTSDLVAVVLVQRVIDIGTGGSFSDWSHLTRALAVDGLELYMVGKTVHIRQSAQTIYPHTFKPDDGYVLEYRPSINHVGTGTQSKNPVPAGNKGTIASEQGTQAQEASASATSTTTHRALPQGPKMGNKGAHTESTGDNKAPSIQKRKRKDEAALTIRALPDIGLQHIIQTSGWGAKFDHNWHLVTVHHSIAGRSAATTSLTLTSEPSGASQKQAGILPAGTAKAS
jgi:hypothetical protein